MTFCGKICLLSGSFLYKVDRREREGGRGGGEKEREGEREGRGRGEKQAVEIEDDITTICFFFLT